MNDTLRVGIAAWRLARLLVREDGPFEIFERLRARAGVPTVGYPLREPMPLIHGILSCPWCASVWAAGILWFLRRTPIVSILAAAGIAAALVKFDRDA